MTFALFDHSRQKRLDRLKLEKCYVKLALNWLNWFIGLPIYIIPVIKMSKQCLRLPTNYSTHICNIFAKTNPKYADNVDVKRLTHVAFGQVKQRLGLQTAGAADQNVHRAKVGRVFQRLGHAFQILHLGAVAVEAQDAVEALLANACYCLVHGFLFIR